MKQEIISVCVMKSILNLNFNKLIIPGILSLVYILNYILLLPAVKV